MEENIDVTFTEDSSFFTDANLADVDGIFFLNTSGDIFDSAQELAFETYIANGGGFIGIHAAADTESNWSFYVDLLGTTSPQILAGKLAWRYSFRWMKAVTAAETWVITPSLGRALSARAASSTRAWVTIPSPSNVQTF